MQSAFKDREGSGDEDATKNHRRPLHQATVQNNPNYLLASRFQQPNQGLSYQRDEVSGGKRDIESGDEQFPLFQFALQIPGSGWRRCGLD